MRRFSRALRFPLMASLVAVPAGAQQHDAPTMVDEAALIDAAPAEWLTHGRDYAETRFSPLNQIHTGNVHTLELAWALEIEGSSEGRVEATPLVSNGTIYATGTWNVLVAVDARTGVVKWRWDPALVRGGRDGRAVGGVSLCCGPVNRGVALYQDMVYVALLDGRLVALDAETGQLVWVRQTTPVDSDYSITGAPRVVAGNVIIGNGGAEYGVRGYITAYDAETGEQAWRFYTVPGDPSKPFESPAMEMAAETWHGEWWKVGGGGTAWDAMAYDPEANLLYVGTGNGSPWNYQHRSEGRGDNLFLASILAIDPSNGDLVWHYQTMPGESWDYTAVQSIILADIEIEGEERKVLMQAPKNGFFYVLDRLTGELISAEFITEHVTWASGIDMETGRPILTPEARFDEVGSWLSPGPRGAHNYDPMSWSPDTGLAYIPGQNTISYYRQAESFEPQEGQFNTGHASRPPDLEPRPAPEPIGFLLAWDPVRQEERWRVPLDTQRNGGTMATAGNLLFAGRLDGWIDAHNATTGEKLWEYQLANGPASPVTYELDGRQYLTVMTRSDELEGTTAHMWTFLLGD